MEFIRNLFKEDKQIIGLCGFKNKIPHTPKITPDFSRHEIVYFTNTKNNFLLS